MEENLNQLTIMKEYGDLMMRRIPKTSKGDKIQKNNNNDFILKAVFLSLAVVALFIGIIAAILGHGIFGAVMLLFTQNFIAAYVIARNQTKIETLEKKINEIEMVD